MNALPCGCYSRGKDYICPVASCLWLEVGVAYRKAIAFPSGSPEQAQAWIAYLEKRLEYDRHIHNTEAIRRITRELQEELEHRAPGGTNHCFSLLSVYHASVMQGEPYAPGRAKRQTLCA